MHIEGQVSASRRQHPSFTDI